MRKSLLRLCVLSSPLLLGACGEGWEFQRNNTMIPYGNQRTAGTGVAYVRAKMMPEKELKVEPVLDAEEIFIEAQTKGAHAPVAQKVVYKEVEKEPALDKPINVIENKVEEALPEKDANLGIPIDVVDKKSEVKSPELSAEKLSAEKSILNAPKEVGDLEVESIDQMLNVEPEAGGDVGGIFSDEDTVLEVYENTVSQPIKEIVVPKKDFFDFKSDGQVSLDEIYEDPLLESDF